MTPTQTQDISARVSYLRLFRIVFVIFFLYLLGDVFFRWDGFRHHASFLEFLPGVALILILWSIIAALTAFLIWLMLKVLEWICRLMRLKVRTDQLLLFITSLGFLAFSVLAGKRFMTHREVMFQFKLLVLLCLVLTAFFISRLLRKKFIHWFDVIQEKITPLVWLFGLCAVLSVPLIVYETWVKEADFEVSQNFPQPSGTNKDHPNILLVTFDALTTKDMSTYGYQRETSPFITSWAKTASLFKRLEAESNFTGPTTASLMTGKRVWTHRRQSSTDSPPLKSKIESLPLLLRNNGYYTMAFIANVVCSPERLGMTNAFSFAPKTAEFIKINSLSSAIEVSLDRMFLGKFQLYDWLIKEDFIFYKILLVIQENLDQLRKRHSTRVAPEIAFNKFLAALDDNPPKPFFAWIHVLPPHDPYMPSEPYMGMYDPSPDLRTGTSQYKIIYDLWYKLDKNPHTFKFPEQLNPKIIDTFRARYNEFINYVDNRFEHFITELSKRDSIKDTVIIMSADHGDIFRPPFLTHGFSLYENETHIPLIIKEPGQVEGRVINDLAEQIDIPATILNFADIPLPHWMEGRSLVPLLRGGKLPPRPAFSMGLQFNSRISGAMITEGDIAVWEGDYKLIYNLEREETSLYNLKDDDNERVNLADKEPETAGRLRDLVLENLGKANERISSGE